MATKKKATAKRKGPVTVAELQAKSKAKPRTKDEPKAQAASRGDSARETAREAYRFVSENLKASRKKLPFVDLSLLDQVQDKLLGLLLEVFEKQQGKVGGNKRDFRLMRREWLRRRLAGLAPIQKIDELRQRLKKRGKGSA